MREKEQIDRGCILSQGCCPGTSDAHAKLARDPIAVSCMNGVMKKTAPAKTKTFWQALEIKM